MTFAEKRDVGRLLDRIQYEGMNLMLRSRHLRVAPAVAGGPAPSSSQGVRAPSCRRWVEGKEQGGHHDPPSGRESCSSPTEA